MDISNLVQRAIDNPSSTARPKFVVEIDLSNAAFGEEGQGNTWEASMEVARLLREAADAMYGGFHPRKAALMDYNGATVGYYEFKE